MREHWYRFCGALRAKNSSWLSITYGIAKPLLLVGIILSPIIVSILKCHLTKATCSQQTWLQIASEAEFLPVWAAAAILAIQLSIKGIDARYVRQSLKRKKKEYSAEIKSGMNAVISDLSELAKIDARDLDRHCANIYGDLLRLIQREVRLYFKSFEDGYINVTLMIYVRKNNATQIVTLQRATTSRPIGGRLPAESTICHFAGLFGRHFDVPNISCKSHPFDGRGLSSPDTPYKSILCIPLIYSDKAKSKSFSYGIVTIDCATPYVFPFALINDIVTRLEPYCSLIKLLLRQQGSGRVAVKTGGP